MSFPRSAIALLFSFLLYAGLLFAAGIIAPHVAKSTPLTLLTALLPCIGVILVLAIVIRTIRASDEFQQRIQFEAIAFAFAATALLTFSWGFMEDAGLPTLPTFAILPLMAALWGIGLAVTTRRFK